ncbi:acyl-CoA reductase [Magnetospirillum sp. SS-4]|uniref:acyl-CoA reductase n=1 Tax=Magnetospirillum sp. SS-4 TaxID=2681465 RepID=UPI0013856743|nr:acyl-CoA reductase [Magnetospirillum sp. SS-4]CAA7618044.1 conserved hypothetical protein [Magnetospirillum sp. SS-4]
MIVARLAPFPAEVRVLDLLAGLDAAAGDLVPFDPETVAFGQHLSERLFADPLTRAVPELAALAFRLRAAATAGLHRRFLELESDAVLRVPRGLAFHVAPVNVETMFVQSWWLSALCGNRNVVRVSARSGDAAALLARLMAESLAEPAFARLGRATALISYPHDEAVSRALSLAADLRLVWGGDAAIAALRHCPIRPDAVELAFPDRRSLAAIAVPAYAALAPAGRDALAGRFFLDAYGFDQMACASPLLLAWVGAAEEAASASDDFWPRLADEARRRGHDVSTGAALARLTGAARLALDGDAGRIRRFGDSVVVASGSPSTVRASGIGSGLFQEVAVDTLGRLAGLIDRRIQTIGHFGFDRAALVGLARRLNGRGGDRLVPIGQALEFSTLWDGHDLLAAMTRLVHVVGEISLASDGALG